MDIRTLTNTGMWLLGSTLDAVDVIACRNAGVRARDAQARTACTRTTIARRRGVHDALFYDKRAYVRARCFYGQ